MNISNKTILALAALLLLGILLHQHCLCRRRNPPPPAAVTSSAAPVDLQAAPPATAPAEPVVQDPAPEEVAVVLDPYESPAVRERMLDEQVRRMQEYALEAGPDDPFSKTPEQIEEFRKRGNPIVW